MAAKNYTIAYAWVAAAFLAVVALAGVGIWSIYVGADRTADNIQQAKAEEKPLKLAVFPRLDAAATLSAFQPLAERLQARLQRPVTLVTSADFDSFWQRVAQREPDLVYYTQYHYVRSHKEHNYRALGAIEADGKKTLAGVIVVHKDAGIKSLAELKGKTIAFGGDRKAVGAYLLPVSLLLAQGWQEGTDFKVHFAPKPPGAVIAAHAGLLAQAAGTGDTVLGFKQLAKIAPDMVVLAKTGEYVSQVWAVKAEMPGNIREQVLRELVALSQDEAGRKILQAAEMSGIYPVDDAAFNDIRTVIRTVTGESY